MAATDERTIFEEDSSEENIGHGFLTLTSRRLMFDKIEGIMHKRRIKMLNIPLSNIKNAFMDHPFPLVYMLTIETNSPTTQTTKKYRFMAEKKEYAEKWVTTVKDAISQFKG